MTVDTLHLALPPAALPEQRGAVRRARAQTPSATDLFCGGGGSSLGLSNAGFQLRRAVNHWQLAADVLRARHPEVDAITADINAMALPDASTTLLAGSPECTTHSLARSYIPAVTPERTDAERVERSRATMWAIPTWLEHFCQPHIARAGQPVQAVIVENVVDVATRWAPYQAWKAAIEAIDGGWVGTEVSLNSGHFGAATSRNRLYVVFTRAGATRPDLNFRPQAACERCDTTVAVVQRWRDGASVGVGVHGRAYDYACPACEQVVHPPIPSAASVLDLDRPGQLIGERTRPVTPRSRQKIEGGLELHGRRPFLFNAGGAWGGPPRSIDRPFPTLTTRESLALVTPPVRGRLTVDRCGFRMVSAGECARAMGFPDDYPFTGTTRDRHRMIGNAVTPPVMEALGRRVLASLGQLTLDAARDRTG